MSKEVTAKEKLLARVAAMQKKIAAATDEELKAWADKVGGEGCDAQLNQESDAITNREKATVEKSTGVDADAAADGQNARANANWPMTANLKQARRLASLVRREAKTIQCMLNLASKMQAVDDAEEDGEKKSCAASKLIRMAMKRSRSATAMMKMARKSMKADDMGDEDDADEGKEIESSNSHVASRLVTIAKSLVADEDKEDKDDGKEIAAALVELAKSLASSTEGAK